MSRRVGNVALSYTEAAQQCDLCGEVAELRPYGPHGECICHDCGMKDKATTMRMIGIMLFGEPVRAVRAARERARGMG